MGVVLQVLRGMMRATMMFHLEKMIYPVMALEGMVLKEIAHREAMVHQKTMTHQVITQKEMSHEEMADEMMVLEKIVLRQTIGHPRRIEARGLLAPNALHGHRDTKHLL